MTHTSNTENAKTSLDVFIDLIGSKGNSGRLILENENGKRFRRGHEDTFEFEISQDIGDLQSINVSLCDSCTNGWGVDRIHVTNKNTQPDPTVYNFEAEAKTFVSSRKTDQYIVLRPGEKLRYVDLFMVYGQPFPYHR